VTEDGGRPNGIVTRGQITTEHLGGWSEIVIAIRDALVLFAVEMVSVGILVLVSIVAGPWSLVALFPALILTVTAYFDQESSMSRYAQAAWGALALIALLVLPDEALVWWPWWWQRSRETWWGLLWPGWWRLVIPSAVVFRAALVAGVLAGWRHSYHLKQRLIQEIRAPTLSGATYTQAEAHAVELRDYDNPYRNPAPPPEPAPTRGDIVVRYVPAAELDERGDANHLAAAVLPLSIIARNGEHEADTLRRAEGMLDGMQHDGRASRKALQVYGLSDPAARELQAWMAERGYVADYGDGSGYVVTDLGRRWLRIVERHMLPF
jgi:hypothetical protein